MSQRALDLCLLWRVLRQLGELGKCAGWCEQGQRGDKHLSALLDPGVSQAWTEGEIHQVIGSVDWMMHHSLVLSW